MIGAQDELPGDLRKLLERERAVPALPAETRERILARARKTLADKGALPPRERRPIPVLRWAVSGAVVALASAAGGVAAFELCLRMQGATAPVVSTTAIAKPGPRTEPPAKDTDPSPVAYQTTRRADDEVRLLARARLALAHEEFGAAMGPILEHARRFKHGRLTEEREALRVKALSGLGLREEVRRAAAAFEARFPRSPLVPAVNQLASSR